MAYRKRLKICELCRQEYLPIYPPQRFCGYFCSNKWNAANRRPVAEYNIDRLQCSESSKKRWADPLLRKKMIKAFRLAHSDPIVRKRYADATRKSFMNPERRRKASEANMANWKDETYRKRVCKKMSIAAKKRCSSKDYRIKFAERMKARRDDPQVKEQMRRAGKRQWLALSEDQKIEKMKKLRRACGILRPNNAENALSEEIRKMSDAFHYVGDASFHIGNLNPDFVDESALKVIELFGEYWHKRSEERKRILQFKKLGWSCLIIWCKELTDQKQLSRKLKEFVNA